MKDIRIKVSDDEAKTLFALKGDETHRVIYFSGLGMTVEPLRRGRRKDSEKQGARLSHP